ncbi:hypothetical protein CTM86_08815 [Fusobacterium pseudoperiodonticum]|jgi:hypothetical protein|uniref:Lipoprotein n=1 Tax=Fusobacterium pseudoperiodonticum TaxID=2663009 RepID=A0A2G9EEZ0_9FUSO|nr:hypothetical protein [Fusobacterium pseudoperiodonticum]ATV57272.1 hypothetical protein CTM68_06105 [Fusobacterium pseudoperiodonticum]ATV59646.1 hypothetical protein CTM72_07960 [Fusobacterium pseudoperiodonticum]ATV64910.1 hypothetical protein CTM78_11415 [Fusobacterium pseudoperiodonticum]ATV66688.1 hypothetical protein CTM86_08815 [Fusobacterium pseudoperiodonticum]ATV68130.1 hypothetical protein CTM92_05490 [Fusobacterium pseudoperiodonticum]
MKKIILLIAMVFLLISCSNNNYVQKGFSQNEKQALVLFKDEIKSNLSENNLAYIKENTKDSYRNRYILEKLQNIDFTKLNIFVSQPSYTTEYPSSILALNMNEDTYYFDLIFIYDKQNKKWLIFDLKEKE